MSLTQRPRHYRLDLKETSASTGYFAAVPQNMPTLEAGLACLRMHPNDSFMHAHLMGCLLEMGLDSVLAILKSKTGSDSSVRALVLEAATVEERLAGIQGEFKPDEIKRLATRTPLVFLRSALLTDQAVHRQWARLFHANIIRHRPLPPPATAGLPWPVEGVDGSDAPILAGAHLKAIVDRNRPAMAAAGQRRWPLKETIAHAMARLSILDIFEGSEMRHQSSLSRYALLRKWRFNHMAKSGKLKYTLSSTQTSYGRGLSLEAARASCLIEVAERCSAFAGVADTGILGTRRPHPLIHGSLSTLEGSGYPLLDPNGLGLEAPYRDEPLYWMEGERSTAEGTEPIWVPVQCVYLFSNLDERSLFSGLGSSGLASGNTLAEARLSAVCEVLERDSEAVNPYHPSRCFRIYSKDTRMSALLEDYRARGIHLQFQDISPGFGSPCCTCFVTHRDGTVAKGGGANLSGQRAVLSALTETPYPYPVGPPSTPVPADLPWLEFETLPDFSTGIPDQDLMLVERTMLANGFVPIYVDITRKDLDIPVVKVLIPGMEMMADFDQYCRIGSRLFNNYLKIHK